jgi:hypothetical protein
MFDSNSKKTGTADSNTTIGVAMVENELGYKVVTGWNFIIPLKDWHNPKCAVAPAVTNNELFGHIVRCTTKGFILFLSVLFLYIIIFFNPLHNKRIRNYHEPV